MSEGVTTTIGLRVRQGHELVLEMACKATDDELGWRAGAPDPSIAFHVWYLARWADRMQATLPGVTPELGRRLGPSRELWETED